MRLAVLDDDRGFFPLYEAVILYRLDLEREAPGAIAALKQLEGRVNEARMIRANARVVLEGQPPDAAARALIEEAGLGEATKSEVRPSREIGSRTLQHLKLVGISLGLAIVVGVPLGIAATHARWLAAVTLAVAGIMQTVPSLALLAFLIPWLGIGERPALVALFLYSLLPIVRNTFVGLTTIAPGLEESARALGLRPWTHVARISLPLASPSIMAGIKISAVINVGTATLAALIGAGGLGDPILAGIQLRRPDLILEGAVPAALLALSIQWGFDAIDAIVIPRGLRLPRDPSVR
jgi:osmoprotectant transport system permease protein